MTPAAIIPMHTPEEAIEELEFVTRSSAPRSACSAAACRGACRRRPVGSGRNASRRLVRRARHRQPLRLRPGMGEVRRAQDRADLPQRGQRPGPAQLAEQLRLQPHRPFRGGRPRGGEGDLPGRRDAALPRAALRLPRRRRRLGLPALRRPHRALGAARRAGAGAHGSAQARPQAAAEPRREVRLRGHRAALHARDGWPDPDASLTGGVARARRLRGVQDHAQGGLGRALRQAVLLRLRGGRPHERRPRSARATRSARS